MAFDPSPFDGMPTAGHQGIQALPQIGILHWLFGCCFPAFGFPAMYPFGDPLSDIFTVQVQDHMAGSLQCGEGFDDRHQFHAVVGGLRFTTTQFPLMGA